MAEYIEREALIENLREFQKAEQRLYNWATSDAEKNKRRSWIGAISVCISEARNAPAADVVEVRHGEWVQDVYDKMMDIYRCSCCETSWSVIDNDMERFNYCPNCGAKMDGKGEGE